MHRTLLSVGCAMALASGGVMAQQPHGTAGHDSGSDGSLADKAREAARAVTEKSREMAEKVQDKAREAKPSGRAESSRARELQRHADAAYKSARDKCDAVQQPAEKNLCEKQAAAAHAKAEVDVARAEVDAQRGGKTSTMGAGKSR